MTFHDPHLQKLMMDDFTQADLPDLSGQYWRKKQGPIPLSVGLLSQS